MNIPTFPTDNLYKFITIFGLTLLFIGVSGYFYFVISYEIPLRSKIAKNEAKMEVANDYIDSAFTWRKVESDRFASQDAILKSKNAACSSPEGQKHIAEVEMFREELKNEKLNISHKAEDIDRELAECYGNAEELKLYLVFFQNLDIYYFYS